MPSFKAPEELDLFFTRLYHLKMMVKTIYTCTTNLELENYAKQIYEILHELYKTEEEHEEASKNFNFDDRSHSLVCKCKRCGNP